MADEETEEPIHSQVSAYLRRPLRTLKKAEQDNDAARHHRISVSSAEHKPQRQSGPPAPRFPKPTDRETPASAKKAALKR
jgi:hypothetical protein